MSYISLSHSNGGVESNALINDIIAKILGDVLVQCDEDAGMFIAQNRCAISTDSFVVSPIFFAGGDIGKLCVCGSSNDVLMRGGIPRYMTLALMLEEGLEISVLERILHSIRNEAKKSHIQILSGDTKVLPKGSIDSIYINTTAIGDMQGRDFSVKNIDKDDDIILSGSIGRHGAVIFCARNEIALTSGLESDCAQLYPMIKNVFDYEIHTMRDATRGGLAAVLNEWARSANLEIHINESAICVESAVSGVCEILGLEATSLACEGICVLCVPKSDSKNVLKALKSHPLGTNAAIIGEVSSNASNRVILYNDFGSKRYMQYPQGELLPRIC